MHWYFIPAALVAEFDKRLESIEERAEEDDIFHDACAEFDDKFGKYRVDDPCTFKVQMLPIDEEEKPYYGGPRGDGL